MVNDPITTWTGRATTTEAHRGPAGRSDAGGAGKPSGSSRPPRRTLGAPSARLPAYLRELARHGRDALAEGRRAARSRVSIDGHALPTSERRPPPRTSRNPARRCKICAISGACRKSCEITMTYKPTRNLAKLEVVGSNPIARSNFFVSLHAVIRIGRGPPGRCRRFVARRERAGRGFVRG